MAEKPLLNIATIKERAGDALVYGDVALATDMVVQLRRLFARDTTAATDGQLTLLFRQLQFVRLGAVTEDEALDLLGQHILDSFTVPEYDLQEKIIQKIDNVEDPEGRVAFMEELVVALEHSKEQLGSAPIVNNGKSLPPTLANWFSDFDAFPTSSADRSGYEIVSYVNTSATTKVLSTADKQKLLKILKLYDYIRDAVAYIKGASLGNPEDVLNNDLDPTNYLPGLVEDTEIQTPQRPVAVPTRHLEVPAAFSSPVSQKPSMPPPIVPVRQSQPQVQQPSEKPASVVPAQAPRPEVVAGLKPFADRVPQKTVNIQDILNQKETGNQVFSDTRVGLSFSREPGSMPEAGPALTKPLRTPPPDVPEKADPRSEIDKKLAELKKRKTQQ